MSPTDGEVVQKYVAYRDFLKRKQDALDEELRPYVEAMAMMEGLMATRLKERGDQSIKTEFGTVYQATTLSYRVADREIFLDFVKESDAYNLLAANIAKDALKEHIDEHQGSPPPGVEITWITKTQFRRS